MLKPLTDMEVGPQACSRGVAGVSTLRRAEGARQVNGGQISKGHIYAFLKNLDLVLKCLFKEATK